MNVRASGVAIACLLVVATVGVAPASTATTPTASVGDEAVQQADGDTLSGLEETMREIDQFLETVIDLVRTINELTGEAEGGD
ncbi:hypothetical protein SAMN04487948_12515 [Halogranum amylolyticum]|uniref:Uncharacterized protein n=1 Tax=Halogranum amylolyticum TaxID=660520 RepID=A0A1H8W811_9EURY|nr:hypothetical protein [Halogranum amylolyticum]SEP23771.1 hypothetical protein SAMN04487948_12515 [Halogranum amylolyticum]